MWFWLSISGNPSEKLHCGNVVNLVTAVINLNKSSPESWTEELVHVCPAVDLWMLPSYPDYTSSARAADIVMPFSSLSPIPEKIKTVMNTGCITRGHVNIGIIFLFIGNSQWCLYNTQSILIGCSTLSQEQCNLIDLYWKLMRRQLWTLSWPIVLVSRFGYNYAHTL